MSYDGVTAMGWNLEGVFNRAVDRATYQMSVAGGLPALLRANVPFGDLSALGQISHAHRLAFDRAPLPLEPIVLTKTIEGIPLRGVRQVASRRTSSARFEYFSFEKEPAFHTEKRPDWTFSRPSFQQRPLARPPNHRLVELATHAYVQAVGSSFEIWFSPDNECAGFGEN